LNCPLSSKLERVFIVICSFQKYIFFGTAPESFRIALFNIEGLCSQ
jgi:hypothetical protein